MRNIALHTFNLTVNLGKLQSVKGIDNKFNAAPVQYRHTVVDQNLGGSAPFFQAVHP